MDERRNDEIERGREKERDRLREKKRQNAHGMENLLNSNFRRADRCARNAARECYFFALLILLVCGARKTTLKREIRPTHHSPSSNINATSSLNLVKVSIFTIRTKEL